jgi:hypothetical protein
MFICMFHGRFTSLKAIDAVVEPLCYKSCFKLVSSRNWVCCIMNADRQMLDSYDMARMTAAVSGWIYKSSTQVSLPDSNTAVHIRPL